MSIQLMFQLMFEKVPWPFLLGVSGSYGTALLFLQAACTLQIHESLRGCASKAGSYHGVSLKQRDEQTCGRGFDQNPQKCYADERSRKWMTTPYKHRSQNQALLRPEYDMQLRSRCRLISGNQTAPRDCDSIPVRG
jgi:hypothetical protein